MWIYVRWANTHYDAAIEGCGDDVGPRRSPTPSPSAVFLVFIALSLGITVWASRRTRSTDQFLCGRPQRHRAAERARARRRLHERGQLPRHRRPGGALRLRRPHLLGRIPRRLADRDVPHRRAAAESRTLHVRRRRGLQASAGADPDRRVDRLAGGRVVLPDRADGRRRQPDPAAVRHPVRGGRRHRRRRDARLRAVRRHDRDDLGADRQGRAPAGRRVAAGAAGAGALQLQSAGALRAGRDHVRRRACWRRAGSSPIRSTRCRSGWR